MTRSNSTHPDIRAFITQLNVDITFLRLKDGSDRILNKSQALALAFLWKNRRKYKPGKSELSIESDFEYPEYGGIPSYISNRLDSDFVDLIQMNWYELQTCGTIQQWARMF
jgi:hypothetical protein